MSEPVADLPEKQEPADAEAPDPFFIKTMKIAAWPLSLGIGWWWGNESARNSLYDTIKHSDQFKPIRNKHWNEVNRVVEGGLHAAKQNASGIADIIKPLAEEHRAFDEKTAKYFKKLGFKPYNTIKYINGISRNEAIKAGMMAFGAGTFTLGVMYALADTKILERLLARKHKDEERKITK